MADEEHIKWLLEGVDAWNDRRNSQNFQPNFWSAHIYRAFQESGKLNRNGKAPLYSYNLDDAIFVGADLRNVDFSQAKLRRVKFQGAYFFKTNFLQADLTDAEFGIGNLGDANLSCTTLKRTDLVQIDLSGTDLTWSEFWKAKLYEASNVDLHSIPRFGTNCTVSNVSDLIAKCFEIKRDSKDYILYFRGERDCSWDLRPSVMRPSRGNQFELRTKESLMLLELMSRSPEDFNGMTSALEQLVLAQHFGLKTRLLDVSKNPCVALFSACDDRDPAGRQQDNNKDGRIHVFAVPSTLVKPFNSDTISIITNFAKLGRDDQNLLLGRTGTDSLKQDPNTPLQYLYLQGMHRLYQLIRQEKPHFEERIDPKDFFRVFIAEPKRSFERIRAQAGAFIISAFHERFEREDVLQHNKDIPVYDHYTLAIPQKSKAKILQELSLLNFTRETLYPSLDEVANAVTQRYL